MDRKKWIPRLASLAFFFFLLFSLEGCTRLFYAPQSLWCQIFSVVQQDRDLFWVLKPGLDADFRGKRVRVNTLGFRGPEIPSVKPPDTLRIVCMGGSPTFGWGVEDVGTYPRLLEHALASSKTVASHVQVINASVIGYSSLQGVRLFDQAIGVLNADWVIISYLVNDPSRHRFFRSSPDPDKDVTPIPNRQVAIENTLHRSRLFIACKAGMTNLAGKFINQDPGSENADQPAGVPRVSLDDYKANLESLIRKARSRGSRVLLVKMPVNPRAALRPPLSNVYTKEVQAYQQAMEQVATETSTPLIDAQAKFNEHWQRSDDPLFIYPEEDPVHPDANSIRKSAL